MHLKDLASDEPPVSTGLMISALKGDDSWKVVDVLKLAHEPHAPLQRTKEEKMLQ